MHTCTPSRRLRSRALLAHLLPTGASIKRFTSAYTDLARAGTGPATDLCAELEKNPPYVEKKLGLTIRCIMFNATF